MTVLVTGATGHLGTNLVRALLEEGRTVRAMVRSTTLGLEDLNVEVVEGDVLKPDSLRAAMDGVEVVYHLAAMISIDGDKGGLVQKTNVEGARNTANAALDAGVKRFVHCSSVHAYRLHTESGPIDESSPRACPRQQPAYDNSKRRGEEQIRNAIEQGLDAVIINPTGVIGPCDYRPSRMGRVFMDLYRRRMPALLSRAGFDFVDVRDVIDGAMAAESDGKTGENYLLSGDWYSVRQLAQAAQRYTGVRAPRLSTPIPLARIGVPFAKLYARIRKTDPLFTQESLSVLQSSREVSHEKASEELGYSPRPLHDTIEAIYDCFFERGVLDSPETN